MVEYNQLGFETSWDNCETTIVKGMWKKEFRMTVETFRYLLGLVGRKLKKVDTFFRKAINVEKRLAVIIWRLSTGNSYKCISKVLGGRQIYHHQNFSGRNNAIVKLAPNFIKFPDALL